MKRLFSVILICLSLALCACTEETENCINILGKKIMVYNSEEELNPTTISDEQAHDIYCLISKPPYTGDIPDGFMKQILDVAHFEAVNKLVLNDDIYYFNVFKYNESNLVLIYDSEHLLTCGCIYYNTPVKSEDLKKSKTFKDIQMLDKSLTDNDLGFSETTGYFLISHSEYENDIDEGALSSTLHITDDGLYLVLYDNTLYTVDSEKIKIISIEKVNDKVYNAVYDLLFKDKV